MCPTPVPLKDAGRFVGVNTASNQAMDDMETFEPGKYLQMAIEKSLAVESLNSPSRD